MSYLSTCRLFSRSLSIVVNASCNTRNARRQLIFASRLLHTRRCDRNTNVERYALDWYLCRAISSRQLRTASIGILLIARESLFRRGHEILVLSSIPYDPSSDSLSSPSSSSSFSYRTVCIFIQCACSSVIVMYVYIVVNKINLINCDICNSRWSMMMIQLLMSSTSFGCILN